jgi:2-amino-4-hydroxy-6-hydroxymethyldihydropteridine diphosphokinase
MKEHVSQFASFVAWCLMPNHFHWIVFVKKEKIEFQNSHTMTQSHSMTSAVQRNKSRSFNYEIGILLRSYARAIQKQENFTGSLFQQHTGIKPLIDEIKIEPAYWNTAFGTQINIAEGKSYLETCIEYIHQNPVYSGIVKNPEDWEYSSYRDFVGLRDGKLLDYDILIKEKLIDAENRHPNLSRETINTCIMGIGSNIDAETNISKMLEILKDHVEIVKVSEMIKTKPIGIANQSDFTNGAVKIKTNLNREELTGLLKGIEDKMGRDRTVPKFGPRCIDLDIVVWNGEIVDDDYYTRDFLQKSVSEIS